MNKTIEEITQRLLIPCGYREVDGETHTLYICKGNLIKELNKLFSTEVQKERAKEVE